MYVNMGARIKASAVGAKSEEPPSEGPTALTRSEAVSWGEKQSVIAADAFRSGRRAREKSSTIGERAEQVIETPTGVINNTYLALAWGVQVANGTVTRKNDKGEAEDARGAQRRMGHGTRVHTAWTEILNTTP